MRYNKIKSEEPHKDQAIQQAYQLTEILSALAAKKEDPELIVASINAWMQVGSYAAGERDGELAEHDVTSIGVGFQPPQVEVEEEYDEDEEEEIVEIE